MNKKIFALNKPTGKAKASLILTNKSKLDYTVTLVEVTMLNHYKLIANALKKLFEPLVEVVIHDLEANKIAFITGTNSVRSVGDCSYLSKKEQGMKPGILGPYSKTSHTGSPQKSITIIFEEAQKGSRYMMCINFDITQFKEINAFLKSFIGEEDAKKQEDYFEDNWQDKIHQYISNYLAKKKKIVSSLTREEKKDLVLELYDKGAFDGKNAASYIAQILKISRASVYGYLKK